MHKVELKTRKLATEHYRTIRRRAMRLKYILRQIQTDDANLDHGSLPHSGRSTPATLAQSMPLGGATPLAVTHKSCGELNHRPDLALPGNKHS